MNYHMDDHSMSLDDLRKRLEATDLIPSHEPLLDGIRKKMVSFKEAGITSVAELRTRLKNAKSLASLAVDSKIDPDYLVLLRRVVEGFFPKPQLLRVFDWMDKDAVAKLEMTGIKNTEQLYHAALSRPSDLSEKAGLSANELSEWVALSDLSRVQWVSPTFARVLISAGFESSAKVAGANPEALYEAVLNANENVHFYKGKVGSRDMKRLIAAAAYLPQH